MEEYYLFELDGDPEQISEVDIQGLEASFLSSHVATSTPCDYENLDVAILTDVVDGYGSDLDVGMIGGLPRNFSYFIIVSAETCQSLECTEESSIISSNDFDSRQTSLRSRQQRQLEGCGCEGPTRQSFVREWQSHDTSGYTIIGLTPVDLMEGSCDPAALEEFLSTAWITLKASLEVWTDTDLGGIETAFVKTYNQLNLLNPKTCDPQRRQLSSSTSAVVKQQVNATTILEISTAGSCYRCSSGTTLFEYNDADRKLEPDPELEEQFSCACPERAETLAAPTIGIMFDELSWSLRSLDYVQQLIKLEEKPPVSPTSDPTASPTEKVCTSTLPVNISSSVYVTFIPSEATTSEVDESIFVLAEAVTQVYNQAIQTLYSTCDAEYRQITSMEEAHLETRDTDDDGSTSIDIVYTVTGGCESCHPSSTFFDPEILSEDMFTEHFQNSSFVPSGRLDYFKEVEEVDCTNVTEEEPFEDFIILELVGTCDQLLLSDTEVIERLEASYVATFNDLSKEYCDLYARVLNNATIVRIGETTDVGNYPLEIRLEGTCGNCDPPVTKVFDVPGTDTTGDPKSSDFVSIRGLTVENSGLCYCPLYPVGERAPYESEFVSVFQEVVEGLDDGCVSSVESCSFGTTYDSGVLVEFEGDAESFSAEELSTLSGLMKESVEDLYRNTEERCNPDFRAVSTVTGVIVTEESRRTVRFLDMEDDLNATGVPNTTSIPSSQPSSPMPSSQPSPVLGSSVVVLFYVSGHCNACSSDLLFGDEISGRRRMLPGFDRLLEDSSSLPSSDCFCQLGAVVDQTPPTPEALEVEFATKIEKSNITRPILGLEEVVVEGPTPGNEPSSEPTTGVQDSPSPVQASMAPTAVAPTRAPTAGQTLEPGPALTSQPTEGVVAPPSFSPVLPATLSPATTGGPLSPAPTIEPKSVPNPPVQLAPTAAPTAGLVTPPSFAPILLPSGSPVPTLLGPVSPAPAPEPKSGPSSTEAPTLFTSQPTKTPAPTVTPPTSEPILTPGPTLSPAPSSAPSMPPSISPSEPPSVLPPTSR